jgi:hypothetical protein
VNAIERHVADLIEAACRDVAEHGFVLPMARILSGSADAHTMRLGVPPAPADESQRYAWHLDLLDTRERIARAVDALGLSTGDIVIMVCMMPIESRGALDFGVLLTHGQVGVGAQWTSYLMRIERTETGSRLLPPQAARDQAPPPMRYEA